MFSLDQDTYYLHALTRVGAHKTRSKVVLEEIDAHAAND